MGAGRKPKPPGEKQRHSVTAKLTSAELEELTDAAKGEPVGTLLRRLILRYLARRRR